MNQAEPPGSDRETVEPRNRIELLSLEYKTNVMGHYTNAAFGGGEGNRTLLNRTAKPIRHLGHAPPQ